MLTTSKRLWTAAVWVIDSARIAESLGWNPTDPDRNMDLLRVALGMRTTAIKIARDQNLDGVVRTSTTNPAAVARLTAQTGGTVRTIPMTRGRGVPTDTKDLSE